MNKKMQKLNRTAVAAVLAASGVVVALPYSNVAADAPFSDLKQSNSHYDTIMELYNRDIISGFPDGTFRPNEGVTRGQAAKMIASILNLDIQNVTNPKFKDVSKNSSYYPYIAALVEQGVISGYVDNTYRPHEVITRNQMAKIIVRGFQFTEAKTLNHTFADVTTKNANRFYIQTLINLGITQGTSAVAYSPTKAVTRGQLASFLIRAEKANVHNASVKEITKIERLNGVTYVYLNGVKHTVHSNLRDILNTSNTEVLKGAHIEGTIVGNQIRGLQKITFNAKGAANNVLSFDGNGSTYRGAVAITGNHLRFSNWNVVGEVSIEPAEAKSLSNLYKPLTPKTIASLKMASDNIDWGTITPPSELEPDENDGLVEIPTDNKPKLPTLKMVEHNIQFVNVQMRALNITANRTKVTSNQLLANVRIGGFVREFELHADVNELYIESDDHVTFYGQSDIAKLYKNSYKNLNLYADSVTQLIAVDNKNGWIDLGDFYYADKVIVPPNTLPHDIFNDFLNDSDKIGDLEDPSGNDIDRDPIENTIVPDWEAPTLLIRNIITNLATANVTVNSNEDGTVYYLVKKEIDGEPSIREIMQYTGDMGGHKPVLAGEDSLITISDLEDEEKYIFYAVAVDEAGNVSTKKSEPFEILDASPPNIEPAEAVGLPGGSRIEVTMNPDEPGDYYYYYEPLLATGTNDYTAEEIKGYGDINYRNQGGKGKVDAAGEMKFRIQGLAPLTQYVVYVVMEDKYGNLMTEAKVMQATTTELDDIYPYITDGELHAVNSKDYEFEFYVNEALDPVTANDVNNYELAGTAILNVDGQPTTIKPDSVTYIEGQKKIKIKIPSATALVNGDTIVVRVLPGVKDLAENEFVNINVVENVKDVKNTASYVHDDSVLPNLNITNFQPDALKETGILTYEANKAGTYYYMIARNSFDMKSVSPREFYNMFIGENDTVLNEIAPLSMQGDTGTNTVVVGEQSQSINLPKPLDPFESYSLYMIMKDRSGQLSSIEKVPDILDDSRAPFVRNLKVEATEGSNTSITITIDASEGGRVYYKRFRKDTIDQAELDEMTAIRTTWQTVLGQNKGNHNAINLEIAKEYVNTIRLWSNAELSDDTITVIRDGVDPHEEYIYFFAVQDKVGNMTMYPSTLSAAQSGTAEDYGNDIMERTVYSDGVNPSIVDDTLALAHEIDIFNVLPPSGSTGIGDDKLDYVSEQTFTITFSELLTYQDAATTATAPVTDTPKTTLEQLAAFINTKLPSGTTVTDIEWQKDYTDLNSWDEHRLIFTVSNVVNGTVTLQEEDFANFSDLAIRRITEDIKLEYLAKSASDNGILGVGLMKDGPRINYTPASGSIRASSNGILVQLEINEVAEREIYYYYAVQNDTATNIPTAEQIVNYVKYQNLANKTDFGKFALLGFDGTRFGTDRFDGVDQGGSLQQEIILSGNNFFFQGQKLYFVTTDKYGNVVGSNISANSPGLQGGTNHAVIGD